MFRIAPILLFGANIILIATSWIFYKFPHGDEYLILFMIPLIFIISPFFIKKREMGFLFFMNLAFYIFYFLIGALNVVDVFILAFLLGSIAGASFLVKFLHESYLSYHKLNISKRQREYNDVVNRLEIIDREGREKENELGRISRLYEITKRLAPSLKFEDLSNALFSFLEDNFRFQTVHLLIFSKGELSQGMSKNIDGEDYYKSGQEILDYKRIASYVKENNFKSLFVDRGESLDFFELVNVRADTFMMFPLFIGDTLSLILAMEGASKSSYERFRILVPQIILEFRKIELYNEVQQLSIIDGLTEVYLRRYLITRLEEEVDRARRLKLVFSIAMIDIDHFKECNDNYGHLVGDAVLKKIAERLKGLVREVDMIARYGGEEFCIVLPETNKELAMAVAGRLRKSIETEVFKVFDEAIKATVSIGIASYPDNAQDVETLIEKADTALYKAKRRGRNLVCEV